MLVPLTRLVLLFLECVQLSVSFATLTTTVKNIEGVRKRHDIILHNRLNVADTGEVRIKSKSKFSQLMSEEKISSIGIQKLNAILDDEDSGIDTGTTWSLQWKDDGTIALPAANCSPSIYTCRLPDDAICLKGISPPPLHNKREIHYIPSLLSSAQVQSLLDIITFHIKEQHRGSTPKTKCVVAIEDGKQQFNSLWPDMCIASLLDPIIQRQILPVARSICKEHNMVVADSLVRWYIADDRDGNSNENLPPHYDLTSFASMIIPLNPEECEGGLYVQYGADCKSRCTVDFQIYPQSQNEKEVDEKEGHGMKRGDAILHRYDVMHGVKLMRGTRYSLVLWMAQDEQSMKTHTVPWVMKDAKDRKSVHAAFLHGLNAQDGLYGVEKNLLEAQEYWEWASERGHALSQYMLSMLLRRIGCKDCPSYNDNASDTSKAQQKLDWSERIVSLLKESADSGLDLSQNALAQTFRWEHNGVSRDDKLARKYYIAAAKQGYARSIEALLDESRWKT